MEKIKIGNCCCLFGEKVCYDAGHRLDRYIADTFGQCFEMKNNLSSYRIER